MGILKWAFMIFTFAYGFFNKGGGRSSFDLLPIIEAVGTSVDQAIRRALASFLLAGLAASLMVSGIVMTIITGVFMANGTNVPEIASLMYSGIGIIGASVVLGVIAAMVARGRGPSVSAQMRQSFEAPSAQPRPGAAIEEAVAALIMDFVQARQGPRNQTDPRAQRQNAGPGDSEFANREFMN